MVQECATAVASWRSEDSHRGEEDDGPKSNITSLDSVKESDAMANTGQGREKGEPRIPDEDLTSHDSGPNMLDESAGGASSSNPNPPSPPSSWYYSARIQSMMEHRSEFSSEVESEIESSKVHWSQVDPTSDSTSETEHWGELNRKYFEEIMLQEREVLSYRNLLRRERKFYYRKARRFRGKIYFCIHYIKRKMGLIRPSSLNPSSAGLLAELEDLVVGNKIAEGSQAEIYAASIGSSFPYQYVVKVFKAGWLLRDLEKQWPPGMLNAFHQFGVSGSILGATLLKDERLLDRFAFVMDRCWGDLRKLIDHQMIRSRNQGPPFTTKQVLWIMRLIADGMRKLHEHVPPVVHRDLKAANVLVHGVEDSMYEVSVADYECSVGVVGTGFWRAPEILQQVKRRVPSSELEFTKEADVYSFGMTCYELVTGRIPFEGHPHNAYDLILNGNRPELPPDLKPLLHEIITTCWDPNPSTRPTFLHIWEKIPSTGYHYFQDFL